MTEPKLCEDCPLKVHIESIKKRSYTTTPSEPTNVNVCSKLRALAASWGFPGCRHFPKNEDLKQYLASSGHKSDKKSGSKPKNSFTSRRRERWETTPKH